MIKNSTNNLFCYMFGHNIQHFYDCDWIEEIEDYGPEYIRFMFCSRKNCDYRLELS